MEHYQCPGCGKIIILEGRRVMHEVPECAMYIRKINEALGQQEPERLLVRKDSLGVMGDRCESGNECGRIGCENCQK